VLSHFETRREKVLFCALVAIFALALGVALASAARQAERPFPGFAVWENLVVPAIAIGAVPAARERIPYRSVVVAVEGRPVRDAAALREDVRAVPPGTPLTYTFERDGRRTAVTMPTAVLHWRDILGAYAPYLFNGVALFTAALVGYYFKPRLAAARAFLALGGILGGVLVFAVDTLSSFWCSRLYFCLESLLPGALLHLALSFPVERPAVRRRPWLLWAVYLPFIIPAILQNVALRTSPERHLQVNDWAYALIALAGLVLLASLAHSYVRSRSALVRQQVRVVTAGMTIAVLVPSLGLLSIILLGVELPINQLWPLYVAGPASIGYAIARHNLFEVDRVLRTGVVYGALSLVALLAYSGGVVIMEKIIGAEQRLPASFLPIYLVVLILVFNPLRSRIQLAVDRLFHRQVYDYRATVEATSRSLAAFLDTDRIATTLLDTLTEVMAIEWGVLMVFGRSSESRRIYSRPQERVRRVAELFPPNDATVAAIARERRLLTRYEVPPGRVRRHPAGFDFERFDELGVALLLPVRFEDEPVGLLMLGEKQSGAYYTEEDIDLIQTLDNQCALALTNAGAYEIIRQTQAELVRAERLAAVGELAAAVAHGIRNPLAGIHAAAQVAREDAVEPGLIESLDDIIGEAGRLETRVRTLLNFAKPFEPKLVWADLNAFLQDFTGRIRKRIPAGIRFAVELDPVLPTVRFDAVQMTEILDALVVNAIEAMTDGGALAIRSRLDGSDGVHRDAVLTVSDTGPGIDAARRERIFDLFYTTKASGTGIGLAAAKRLVDQHGGAITVDSAPGAGTTFVIRLPVPVAPLPG